MSEQRIERTMASDSDGSTNTCGGNSLVVGKSPIFPTLDSANVSSSNVVSDDTMGIDNNWGWTETSANKSWTGGEVQSIASESSGLEKLSFLDINERGNGQPDNRPRSLSARVKSNAAGENKTASTNSDLSCFMGASSSHDEVPARRAVDYADPPEASEIACQQHVTNTSADPKYSYPEYTTILLDTGEKLAIPTEILKLSSRYFSKALNSKLSFIEQDGLFKLSDVDLKTMHIYKAWIETGAIKMELLSKQVEKSNMACDEFLRIEYINKCIGELIDCYILGDYIDTPAFGNDVIDVLFNQYMICTHVPLENICDIVERTPESSMLRKMVADFLSCRVENTAFRQAVYNGLVPIEMILDVKESNIKYNGELYGVESYKYHRHPEGALILLAHRSETK